MEKTIKKIMALTLIFIAACPCVKLATAAPQSGNEITVRTESYPRPPYSGATYYFYERTNQVICTKLEVCNKFGECGVDYKTGLFKEEEDKDAFEKKPPTLIQHEKLKKHRCLTIFGLIK